MIDHKKILDDSREEKTAEFSAKITPGGGRFLGVRLPVLRKLAKQIAKDDWRSFLADVDDEYEEYKMLRGMVICYAKMDLEERLAHIRGFVPAIENWAVCDTCQYKAKDGEKEEYWNFLQPYLTTPSEFGMRFGVVALLSNFIDEEHIDRVLDLMDSTKHDGYYLKMGVAWTVSVCFVKFPDRTMEFLKNDTLDDFTYNKSLQKIVESFRVDDRTKDVIRGMRRKR